MRDVNSLKNAMEHEVNMLKVMDEAINSNKDVLTEEELKIVTAYIESVRTPWSLVLKACEAVINKQETGDETDKETVKPEDEPKTTKKKAKAKKEAPAEPKPVEPVEPEPAEPAEEVDEDEDWDFLDEED